VAKKILLSGIKPTGSPHLGNYIGMIQPALDLANNHEEYLTLLFIADYHALNTIRDGAKMRSYTYDMAATMLALGLNPENMAFFRQSDIPEVFELTTILSAVTPKGLMNRAHAYKAAIAKNTEKGEQDIDAGINMGLYTYPLLMASDILLYNSDVVPVGKDQIQHVEFARDIAGSFNYLFGNVLKLPEYFVKETAASIPGLDGQKMSKSYGNTIPIFEESNKLRKLIMRIVTDSKLPEEPKNPEESTIFHIYREFATAEQTAELKSMYENGGLGYGAAKEMLFELMIKRLEEPKRKYDEYIKNTAELDKVLNAGADRARSIASKTIQKVRKKIGVN